MQLDDQEISMKYSIKVFVNFLLNWNVHVIIKINKNRN